MTAQPPISRPGEDDYYESLLKSDTEKRQVLKDWVGQRVGVEGIFRHAQQHPHNDSILALMEDAEVVLADRSRYSIGHVWIQKAAPLKGITSSAKIRFTAKVKEYTKSKEPGVTQYGLMLPNHVEIIEPPAMTPPPNPHPEVDHAASVGAYSAERLEALVQPVENGTLKFGSPIVVAPGPRLRVPMEDIKVRSTPTADAEREYLASMKKRTKGELLDALAALQEEAGGPASLDKLLACLRD